MNSEYEDERTFAALPPAHGRGFAQSWWGLTWLKALEDTALDTQQLKQGRKYARQGAVGAVSVRPGRITAVVRDRDGTPHRADVLLQQLGAESWDRLLDVVSGEAGHLAALLDRDMPPRLVEDAAGAGVELLPGIGDLDPECGCEAWDHCLHTTALCYQMARLLDQDPFVLLLLRGRGERALLDELQTRSAARGARESAESEGASAGSGSYADGTAAGEGPAGVDAEEAYALGAILPSPPGPPALVEFPGDGPVLDSGAAPPEELDVEALKFLVAATAVQAQRALAEALAPGHADSSLPEPLGTAQDTVRLAAAHPGPRVGERLTAAGGRTSAELEPAVRAWEFGGAEALAVLEEAWSPEPDALARVSDQLAALWPEEEGRAESGRVLRADGNRWTVAGSGVQLRYGRDGRWWPYRRERGRWWPAGPAEPDPGAALATVLSEG
ncbi:SWF or SNF family helicase [Streptomyces sp. N2-109]|uniref:SWF or SNF family helicase n=1 Tax=Streptomyces gossypii TaxID=2883101 RepID=A0ABT2JU85_9ACTN|nr:SWF or SNF family helicase [Streptomyces gossypii]MCT2591467.1 SWF or SNF family helicase [Streptomyces gossypii]